MQREVAHDGVVYAESEPNLKPRRKNMTWLKAAGESVDRARQPFEGISTKHRQTTEQCPPVIRSCNG